MNYKEFLDNEIVNACKNFEEAKRKAIEELNTMSVWTATEYGAGYAAHIEQITRYAAEVQKLSYAYRAYEAMEKNKV